MNAARYLFFLFGLVGLLTGCVTPTDMGYVVPAEPVYATPVYNSSPAYYATPVSGYSTMTVYDGYHPGYGGPRYPHHRPPPHHGSGPSMHGGHGGHGGHVGHGGSGGHHGGGKTAMVPAGTRLNAGGHKRTPINQIQGPARKPSPGRAPSGKGGAPGKGGGRRK